MTKIPGIADMTVVPGAFFRFYFDLFPKLRLLTAILLAVDCICTDFDGE